MGHMLRPVEMDVELLSRVRNGDEEAFVMLVARYQQSMLRLARSMVSNQAVAEEAVQDTWLGVVRGIERFEGRSSFKTWLFRILVNRARSAGSRERSDAADRDAARRRPSPFRRPGPVGRSPRPLDRGERAPSRRGHLGADPQVRPSMICRRASVRSSCCEMSKGSPTTKRVAVLGISVGNQRILLHRGRSRLREFLEAKMEKG